MWVLTTTEIELASSFRNRDIISIKEFKREELDFILDLAAKIKSERKEDFPNYRRSLERKIVGLLFCEPSTRTVGSFTQATYFLGGLVNGITDPSISSFKKGESLSDAARVIAGYGMSTLVMRHEADGAARQVSDIMKKYNLKVPVINGGTGSEEHPTQAMLDLFTMREKIGRLDGLNVGIMGDLYYGRTVPSLSYALANYGNISIFYIAPRVFQVRNEVIEGVVSKGVKVERVDNPRKVISHINVLYQTRTQQERIKDRQDLDDYLRVKEDFTVTPELIKEGRPDLIVMHPLPRIDELSYGVDNAPNASYFDQSDNGVYVRMAILHSLIGRN
ncbi:MAG: aspartate carbamoyltransferase [Candidatus Aenigmarchaeota archaeon]|nr:aspartate carbamoyltransferase [Candidatus Aenigmarchaeota archaeon]